MYLKPRQVAVVDLFQDLADGNILAHLMEVLSGESVQTYGRMKFPAEMRIQQIANLSVVMTFIKAHVKVPGLGPQDILEGDPVRVLGLIWTLIEHFAVEMINAHLATNIGSYAELKDTLLSWARRKTRGKPYRLTVNNFTDSLSDGRVFLALLNDGNPKESKYAPSNAPPANLGQAFEVAERVYGLVPMMDPDDPHATHCEPVSIIYMASLYLALPNHGMADAVAKKIIAMRVGKWWRGVQRARERSGLADLKRMYKAQKDELAALRAQLEKLKALYADALKKASALPEVMGKFSELQAYAKSLKAEYERRIAELEGHIDAMAANEEALLDGKDGAAARIADLSAELAAALAALQALQAKHDALGKEHGQCEGVTVKLQVTIDDQARRIAELEAENAELGALKARNAELEAALADKDAQLGENEAQLEEMEEHVESLSGAMVASEAAARELQAKLDDANAALAEAEARADGEGGRGDELEAELKALEDQLNEALGKLEAASDEAAELSAECDDLKGSNARIEEVNDQLRDAVARLTEEKRKLDSRVAELLKAIAEMQEAARQGTAHADNALLQLDSSEAAAAGGSSSGQGDYARARATLAQLKASFDGRSVVDDVVCLQHVVKLVCEELETAFAAAAEATQALADWRSRHATKTGEHAELARAMSDVTSTKEQLLARNDELEAECERLRKEFDESEWALAEATSKWMHLEEDRAFFGSTAKQINRHALSSLKSGQLSGLLVSSVSLALEDLANVKLEALANALGHAPPTKDNSSACAFLDRPADPTEKGEIVWSEELVQMLCTEMDGLRRLVREKETLLADKDRTIEGLEARSGNLGDMRAENEAARDAFYEHKEAWELSVTAELNAQITALREQLAAYEDNDEDAKRALEAMALSQQEHEAALERLRAVARAREAELVAQLEALGSRHGAEAERLKAELRRAEEALAEQVALLAKQRAGNLGATGRLEELEAELRGKQRAIERLEAQVRELEARLDEAEQVGARARALAREKGDLEGQLRALAAEHESLRATLKGKLLEAGGAASREQEKELALETAAARYMQQQTLLDEIHGRAEELTKLGQGSLLQLSYLKAGTEAPSNAAAAAALATGKLDRESALYRAELDANLDLNPALGELMFCRHVLGKLEALVAALKAEDALKKAEFDAATADVTATRKEMEELLDSHQGVVAKMKALQDKLRALQDALAEKGAALDAALARVDDLEARREGLERQLAGGAAALEKARQERDALAAALDDAHAQHDAALRDLREQLALAQLRAADAEGAEADAAEAARLRRLLEAKERELAELGGRLGDAEDRVGELLRELEGAEARAARLRAELEGKGDVGGLEDELLRLQQEKELAEADVAEIHDAMKGLEMDTRNPRLLSVRRAGQMQHIMYEIEDLEAKDLDGTEMDRLRKLHEDLFNIFEDTMCYLKGGMILLTTPEVRKLEGTLSKCKDSRQCINLFKEAHLSCKKIVVSVAPSNTTVANSHWTIPNMASLDQVPDNKYMELLKNIRNLLVAHDMMDDEARSKLSTFVEIMMNLDWLVILGHKAIDVEMARRNKAVRRAYGVGGSGTSTPGIPDYGSERGSDSGSVRSGQVSYKRGSMAGRRADGY